MNFPSPARRNFIKLLMKNLRGGALLESLLNFILVFLLNTRNQSTRIVNYLRRLMTKY
jgi:hypothetical protein